MKSLKLLLVVLCFAVAAWSRPLGTQARTLIPQHVHQIVWLDYRALRNSTTAIALQQQMLSGSMQQFEAGLLGIGIGIQPERDLDQLTFISSRSSQHRVQTLAIANGLFPARTLLHGALDTRDGRVESFNSNYGMTELADAVGENPLCSILDRQGTQVRMRSAVGEAAAGIADYQEVKKRLLGSRYTMSFANGVKLDLAVVTSVPFTATALSTLIKGTMAYGRHNLSHTEQIALDSITVTSENANFMLHFTTDEQKFQSLMHSDLFASSARSSYGVEAVI